MGLLKTGNGLLSTVEPCRVSALRKQQLVSQRNTLANTWNQLRPHAQMAYLKQLVRRIVVGRSEIRVTLSRESLVTLLLDDSAYGKDRTHATDDDYEMTIPVSLKRCGIEMQLIVPNGEQSRPHPITIRALQQAVGKALTWNQALVSGEVPSMRKLAQQENVAPSYIGALIRLAFLAPDIIEAILRGDVPVELSLGRLKKGFPFDWDAQRKTLGFNA